MCVMQAYANSLVDYHLIMDLVPTLACAFFAGKLPATLSAGQAAILLSLGLQQNDISKVEEALNLPVQQLLALFNKVQAIKHSLYWICCCCCHQHCMRVCPSVSGSAGMIFVIIFVHAMHLMAPP